MAQIQSWWERMWATVKGVSVRTKIMGIVLGLVLLLGLGVTLQVRAALAQTLTEELEKLGFALARDLAARSTDLILTNDLFALHELVRDTASRNDVLRYAFVLSADGRVLAHSFSRGVPPDLLTVHTPQSDERDQRWSSAIDERERETKVVLDTEEGLIYDISIPIFDGQAGYTRVGVSENFVREQMASMTQRLLLTTALVSMIGIVGGYALTWFLTRPVNTLVRISSAVAHGDLTQRAPWWAGDEIGALGVSFNAMLDDLARAREEVQRKEVLRSELLAKVISAQEEERKRIARKLHDETGQSLTSLLVGLKAIEITKDDDQVRNHLRDLKTIAADALATVHDLAVELRPAVLDDLGLVAALQRSVKDYSTRFGIAVDFETVGVDSQRFAPQIEITLYRIIQEALFNAARHARARQVSVLLECREDTLVAIVEDDGQGFDVDSVLRSEMRYRLGLYGMEERATLVGGRLTIESLPESGTSVFVEVPR